MEEEKKTIDNITKVVISIIIILVILDQVTKIIMLNIGELNITSNIKFAVVQENTNTSILTRIVQYIIVLGIIIRLMISQNQFIETKMKIFLSLVLAGGIGNFIDIILRKNIISFISIKIGEITLPILNVAYILITIGMILLAGNFAIFTVKEMRNNKGEKIHS